MTECFSLPKTERVYAIGSSSGSTSYTGRPAEEGTCTVSVTWVPEIRASDARSCTGAGVGRAPSESAPDSAPTMSAESGASVSPTVEAVW